MRIVIDVPEPLDELPDAPSEPPQATSDADIAATTASDNNFFFITINPPSIGSCVVYMMDNIIQRNVCQSVDIRFKRLSGNFVN